MPAPIPKRTPIDDATRHDWKTRGVRSRLAAARRHRGVSQEDMAQAVGLSLATYRRLERGDIENPPLRYLVNCALALDFELSALIEDEWLEWTEFKPGVSAPPDQKNLWKPALVRVYKPPA